MKRYDNRFIKKVRIKNTGEPRFDRLIKLVIAYLYIFKNAAPGLDNGEVEEILRKNPGIGLVKPDVYEYQLAKAWTIYKTRINFDFVMPDDNIHTYTLQITLTYTNKVEWRIFDDSDGGYHKSGMILY